MRLIDSTGAGPNGWPHATQELSMSNLRRVMLAFGTVVLLVVGTPQPGGAHGPAATASFTLGARVLDGGEQVTSITIDARGLGAIRPESLSASTFSVHATAHVPAAADPARPVVYDVDRTVAAATLTGRGRIKLDLVSGFSVSGASTLTYLLGPARNVLLDLTYTITQNAPLRLRNGDSVTITSFRQGPLVDPEVDKFAAGVSREGLNYRLYRPTTGRGARPLVIWLHGNGEGGFPGYYDNEAQLRANRGAIGPATLEAQAVFGGAYVLAPQVPDTWFNTAQAGYEAKLLSLVRQVSARNRIDQQRIYVMGASAGGFMSMKLVSAYPNAFAALVPTCPAIYIGGSYRMTADEVLRLRDTPTWFVHARNDPVVPYAETSVWAHELLPGSLITLYPDVTWSGVTYNGHWSWIYTARNAPTTDDGISLWTWMSEQRRGSR
jgi:predicted esterase